MNDFSRGNKRKRLLIAWLMISISIFSCKKRNELALSSQVKKRQYSLKLKLIIRRAEKLAKNNEVPKKRTVSSKNE